MAKHTGINNKLNISLIIAAILLIIINSGLYRKCKNFDFVWDDQLTHLHANRNLMEDNVAEFWKKPYTGLFIPVSYTTWYWIKKISLKNEKGRKILDAQNFHLVNIVMHAVNSVLVLFVLYLLTNLTWASFAGALLFSIHPVQVESVAWISEYRGLLSAFFSLFAIIFYFLFRKRKKQNLFFLSTVFFILAILSKPSAIVLPLIIIAFDYFIFNVKKKEYLYGVVWLIITIPMIIITKSAQPGASLEYVAPLLARPFIAADSINFYFLKFLLPVNLSASYGRTPEAPISNWYIYILCLIPLILLYITWKWRKKEPLIALGIIIFMVAVLPVSGLLPFDFQKFSTVADRYLYISMFGAAIIFTGIFQKFKKNYILYMAGGILAVTLIMINSQQQDIWKNNLTLWKETAEKNPGQPHVHNNYGISLHDVGKFDEAIIQYSIAIDKKENFARAYNNRGNSYAFKRDFKTALKDQSKAIEIDPGYGRAWFNRAVTHFQLGNLDQAMNDLDEAEKRGYRPHPQFRKDLEREIQKQN